MNCFRKSRIVPELALWIFLVLTLLSTELQAKQGQFIMTRPTGAKEVILSVKGKEQTYFPLKKYEEMYVEVQGPGKLRVLSRLNFPAYLKGPQKYVLEVEEKEKIFKDYSATVEKSDAQFKDSNLVPGRMRKFTLEVPEGVHSYGFILRETSAPSVSLKFLFSSEHSSDKLASITPLSYSRVASALIKEKLVSYFVATTEIQVKLRVIGPTKLRIVSRLNYDYQMKGEQKYAVLISENGNPPLTKPLSTSKSVGVEYKDWKEVVPGKSQTFFLDVPSGEHNYSFKLTESIAKSVSLRFSIPEGSLANEE